MIIESKRVPLKDGRLIEVRSLREEDIESMIRYLHLTAEESEFILRYPEECDKYTEEVERALFKEMNESPTNALVLGLIDGRIVGSAMIHSSTSIKVKHRASIGMVVLKECWGLGVGSILMGELIKLARKNENLLQIELDFIEGNARGRALYEKFGFSITGVKPRAIRLKSGELLNEYSMMKILR